MTILAAARRRPLDHVREHRPGPAPWLLCEFCGRPVYPLKFGVWLVWVSLEAGQACPAREGD